MILKSIHMIHESNDAVSSYVDRVSDPRVSDTTLAGWMEGSLPINPHDPLSPRLHYLIDPDLGEDDPIRLVRFRRVPEGADAAEREEYALVRPGWAYLMNDDGKTVDSL